MDVLDHPVLASRYFFPRRDCPTSGEPWSVAVPGAESAGARVGRHGARAVLHFHGNGEVVADWVKGDFASALDAARVDAFFAEYRGYGGFDRAPRDGDDSTTPSRRLTRLVGRRGSRR